MSKYKYAYLAALLPVVLAGLFELVTQFIEPTHTGAEGMLVLMGGLATIAAIIVVGVVHIIHMILYFLFKGTSK